MNRILKLNRTSITLKKYREKADEGDSSYTLKNNLLLYKKRLVMLVEADEMLPALLIKKAHAQVFTAYPGQRKT
jgi:hypothetical protein